MCGVDVMDDVNVFVCDVSVMLMCVFGLLNIFIALQLDMTPCLMI